MASFDGLRKIVDELEEDDLYRDKRLGLYWCLVDDISKVVSQSSSKTSLEIKALIDDLYKL